MLEGEAIVTVKESRHTFDPGTTCTANVYMGSICIQGMACGRHMVLALRVVFKSYLSVQL